MKLKLRYALIMLLAFLCITALASCALLNTEAHEHTFSDEFTITESATPEKDGSKICICTTCGEQVTVTIPSHAHEFDDEWTEKTPATDEAEGTEVRYCKICGDEDSRAIPKHEHTFSGGFTVSKPATEQSSGKKTAVCDTCLKTVTITVPLCDEHIYNNAWTITKAPTMTAIGKETNYCSECGYFTVRDVPVLTIVELKVTGDPYTTSYFTGELFNPFGLEISGVLSDGSEIKIKDFEVLTGNLTAENTYATIKYGDFTVNVPITVSKYINASVSKAFDYADGTFLIVKGICVGISTDALGTKQVLIKDSQFNCILLSGTNYDYKKGDEIQVYTSVASDSYGKYLIYTEENGDGEGTVLNSNKSTAINSANKFTVGKEMTSELLGDGISRYDIVEIGNLFYIVKDGNDYLLHFNKDATSKDDAKIAGGRVIRLSTANINAGIITDRIPEEDLNSYPGALVSGKLSAFYIDYDVESFRFEIFDAKWAYVDPYVQDQEYLYEIAHAFYYQLPYVDYDQYNTRRNINPAPEDATAQQRIYLDCSSYVNAIYYNAFGVNILPYAISEKGASTNNFSIYAKENLGNADVVGHWVTADYKSLDEQKAILDELYNNLQIGDVIVYRKASSGHALIYVGGGKILHCMNTTSFTRHNGQSDKVSNPTVDPLLSYDTVSSASIGFTTTDDLFKFRSGERYLFQSAYVSFSILRPLNRGLTPTEQAEARMTIPGLSIEKSISANMYAAVFTGDELTYTVTLKNNNFYTLESINLLEKVPAGTEFVSAGDGITHSDGSIIWNGSVQGGETVTLSFTVKVTETTAGALIESNEGTVNGLKLNKLTNTVSGISKEKLDQLSEIGYGKAADNAEYSDPILMIKDVYRELLGKDIFDYETVAAALADIINVESKKYNESCAVSDMVIANLSGGYLIRGSNPLNNDRIRAVRIEYMAVGDVIIAEHVSTANVQIYTAYIYLGGSDFLSITSDVGSASVMECKKPDIKKIQNLLTSLYSYDKYAIIRPSMANTAE